MAQKYSLLKETSDRFIYQIDEFAGNVVEAVAAGLRPFFKEIDVEVRITDSSELDGLSLGPIRSAFRPIKEMLKDVKKSFTPYKDLNHDLKKDLKMPWFGLQNILSSLISGLLLALSSCVFVVNQLYEISKTLINSLYQHGWQKFDFLQLLRGVFYDALIIQTLFVPFRELYEVSSLLLEANLQSLRGTTQLMIGTPALILRIPLRMILNYAIDPKVEDSSKIQAEVDRALKINERDGQIDAGRVHMHFYKQVNEYNRPTSLNPQVVNWAYVKADSRDATKAEMLTFLGLFRNITSENHETYNKELTTQAYEELFHPSM